MTCALFAAVVRFDSSDLLKLLGIVAAAMALFLIAKRIGGGGEHISAPVMVMPQDPAPASDLSNEPEGPDPDQPGYKPPSADEETLGPPPEHIRIENWNFTKFDLESGPTDRAAFADELNMQLYDPSTGRRWIQTYFVASPGGLEKMLREKNWNYMFIPQILVIDKYDLQELRSAMLEEFAAVEAQRGEVSPESAE